jgi:hypothetical protein
MLRSIRGGALAFAAGLLSAAPALAQSPAEFYRGKTVTMIGSSASGVGDHTLSRVLATHLGRHIPAIRR